MAWLLGYFLSDGHITKPLGKNALRYLEFICKYDDKELMYKIKDILKTKANVKEHPEYKSPQARLTVNDRKDIIEEYADIKSKVPVDKIAGYERHFIRGCFDGDGTLSYRKSRNSFRIGFIDMEYDITKWITDTIINTLKLPPKEPRWVPQNNVWEVLWEGNLAKLIAWWLYHGDIDNCCLSRKRDKYITHALDNNIYNDNDAEVIKSSGAYIDNKGEIAFITPGCQSLDWCKRLQSILSFKTTPVFHNKGRRKYYHLYIPDNNQIVNMRDKFSAS